MDLHDLQEIGLSKAEIKVYASLLRLGQTASGELTKEVGLRKSTVYESLSRLLEKGLVGYVVKNNVKYFEASDPDRILDFISEQKRVLEEKEHRIKSILPALKSAVGYSKPQAEAHVLVGPEGFKTMRRDVLKHSNGELLLLGAISREDKVIPYYYNQWDKQRIKQGIRMRILHKRKTSDKTVTLSKKVELRFLPAHIDNPVVINIYGDRVVSLIWKGNYPLCFLVVNKEIAKAYRSYFEILWRLSKKS